MRNFHCAELIEGLPFICALEDGHTGHHSMLNGYEGRGIQVKLSGLEMEILENILNGEIEGIKTTPMSYPTVAYIAWIDENQQLQMGQCRGGHRNNYITNEGSENSWDVSPFCGAWTMIKLSQIVSVRHVKAMW